MNPLIWKLFPNFSEILNFIQNLSTFSLFNYFFCPFLFQTKFYCLIPYFLKFFWITPFNYFLPEYFLSAYKYFPETIFSALFISNWILPPDPIFPKIFISASINLNFTFYVWIFIWSLEIFLNLTHFTSEKLPKFSPAYKYMPLKIAWILDNFCLKLASNLFDYLFSPRLPFLVIFPTEIYYSQFVLQLFLPNPLNWMHPWIIFLYGIVQTCLWIKYAVLLEIFL